MLYSKYCIIHVAVLSMPKKTTAVSTYIPQEIRSWVTYDEQRMANP